MRNRLIKLIISVLKRPCNIGGRAINKTYIAETIADHLLRNGVLIPPCKVGDVVYVPMESEIWSVQLTCVEFCNNNKNISNFCVGIIYGSFIGFSFKFEDIGKTVFLTKQEAEKALKGGAE